jgi:hypothetical protein
VRTRAGDWLANLREILIDWRPFALAAICGLLIALLAQLPLDYRFQPGIERGAASDEPFLSDFYPFEGNRREGVFRWSRQPGAQITIPGVGRRPLILDMTVVSHRGQWVDGAGTTQLALLPEAPAAPIRFELRREQARYRILVPESALPEGVLRLTIDTEAWQPQGDRRDRLGIALGEELRVVTLSGGLIAPDLAMLTGYPIGMLLLWVTLRVAGFGSTAAWRMLLPLTLLMPLIMLAEAPRLGFGSVWIVQAGLLGLLAAGVSAVALPPLLARAKAPAPESILRWLILLIAAGFVLKYASRLYPDSMPGDLQLHINRYSALVRGQHYIDAQHRGLPFPFPVGLYLLLAPITLTGLDIRNLFQIATGVFEAASVPLFYILLARGAGSPRLGLIAAAIYTFTAGGHMTSWFMFTSHVSTQFYQLLLMLVLTIAWPRYGDRLTWWAITLLFAQIGMGHIGTFINLAVFGVLIVPLMWWHTRTPDEKRAVGHLTLAGLAAALFVFFCFYSFYLWQFVAQLQGIATVGMNEVTGRNPIPPETSLRVIWEGGLITHFGFFPALLAIPGAYLAARRLPRSAMLPLMLATVLSSLSQAVLPFITLSSITTRWLMFSAWVVAVAAAFAVASLWNRGRAGRVALIAMGGYAATITISVWLDAMTLRLPPIEPF